MQLIITFAYVYDATLHDKDKDSRFGTPTAGDPGLISLMTLAPGENSLSRFTPSLHSYSASAHQT